MVGNAHGHNKALYLLCPPQACAEGALFSGVYPKFQRQKVIGKYIVDFYCAKLKLAIELDGSQHFEDDALEYDKTRTEYINSIGIKVIRFTNHEINTKFRNVCETILNELI